MRFVVMVLVSILILGVCIVPRASSAAGDRKSAAITTWESPANCVVFGLGDLERALRAKGYSVFRALPHEDVALLVRLVKDPKRGAESFSVKKPAPGEIVAACGDDVGAMYAALDLAEQIALLAPRSDVWQGMKEKQGNPAIPLRGVNFFLEVQAFQDPNSWYYQEDYWQGYFDMLARCRFNLVDLHATYEMTSTLFPNVYPYLVKSEKFPEVGVSAEDAARNFEMFKKIVQMAKDRGIKVGLMSYIASWKWYVPGVPEPPYEETDDALVAYTAECVEKIALGCPELAMIGFRIGESGKEEDFYHKSYLAGLAASGRDMALYLRTWVANPENVLKICRDHPGKTYIEIKYNGEQLGLPYHVAGGRMTRWGSYSFESYTNQPQPYTIIWQIRANGTHRLFRWGDPEFVRRTVLTTTLAGSAGFVLEPMNAYSWHDDHWHNTDAVDHSWFRWVYQRDWFWNMLWGRLSYDPQVPEEVWLAEFKRRFGPEAGEHVYRAVVTASQIVPLCYSSHCLGPDHRDMAVEFETAGDLDTFIKTPPFDTTVLQPIADYVQSYLEGKPDARMSPIAVADSLAEVAQASQNEMLEARRLFEGEPKEFECLQMDIQALGALADYYRCKLLAAVELAFFDRTGDYSRLLSAWEHAREAFWAWTNLSAITKQHYRPFREPLRMGRDKDFHWWDQIPKLARDFEVLAAREKQFREGLPSRGAKPRIGLVPVLRVSEKLPAVQLAATVQSQATRRLATVFFRQPGAATFQEIQMTPQPDGWTFSAEIPRASIPPAGLEYYIEATAGSGADKQTEITPVYHLHTSTDVAGPELSATSCSVSREKQQATVMATATDKSGIASVQLVYKPLPSTEDWRTMEMRQVGDHWEAAFPATPAGALYLFRAVDKAGNASQYPEFLTSLGPSGFRGERPYFVIEPWAAR